MLGLGSAAHMRDAGFADRGFSLYTPTQIADELSRAGFDTEKPWQVERGKRGPFFACIGLARK